MIAAIIPEAWWLKAERDTEDMELKVPSWTRSKARERRKQDLIPSLPAHNKSRGAGIVSVAILFADGLRCQGVRPGSVWSKQNLCIGWDLECRGRNGEERTRRGRRRISQVHGLASWKSLCRHSGGAELGNSRLFQLQGENEKERRGRADSGASQHLPGPSSNQETPLNTAWNTKLTSWCRKREEPREGAASCHWYLSPSNQLRSVPERENGRNLLFQA